MYKKGSVVYRQVGSDFHVLLKNLLTRSEPTVSIRRAQAQVSTGHRRHHIYARGSTVQNAAGQGAQATQEGQGGGRACRYHQGRFLGETAVDSFK